MHTPDSTRDTRYSCPPCQIPAAVLLPAQILADHHGPSRGQGGEQVDEKGVEHVHQADPGDGGLPGVADHQGVGDAHQHGQQLLEEQRHDQRFQVPVGEELPPLLHLLFWLYDLVPHCGCRHTGHAPFCSHSSRCPLPCLMPIFHALLCLRGIAHPVPPAPVSPSQARKLYKAHPWSRLPACSGHASAHPLPPPVRPTRCNLYPCGTGGGRYSI